MSDRTSAANPCVGFTLVELLAVIAIISVLAALLLPTLEDAVERGRRIACANNEQQQYLAWSMYCSDFNDHMPCVESSDRDRYIPYSLFVTPADSPIRMFFREYCGAPLRYASGAAGYLQHSNSILSCPSAASHGFGGEQTTLVYPGYWELGIGAFTASANAGSPRLTVMGSVASPGPVIFLQDLAYSLILASTGLYQNYSERNHGMAGGNVTMANGSSRWWTMDAFEIPYGRPFYMNAYWQVPNWNVLGNASTFFNATASNTATRRRVYGYSQ